MSAAAGPAQLGRLVRPADFERVLKGRSRAQGAHFALHHAAGTPSLGQGRASSPLFPELSTDSSPAPTHSVDDFSAAAVGTPIASTAPPRIPRLWLGSVVPKRHARRAVTRTLLKRQIRSVVAAHAASLPAGLWVVRLRAGFDRTTYPSAASNALRVAAREELERLLSRCVEPCEPVGSP